MTVITNSPYLSAGVISARECVRAVMRMTGAKKIDVGKTGAGTGAGRWLQEIGE
jgi:deoxyribodipyrimidine photo-lyase